jgi:hypothetical protein
MSCAVSEDLAPGFMSIDHQWWWSSLWRVILIQDVPLYARFQMLFINGVILLLTGQRLLLWIPTIVQKSCEILLQLHGVNGNKTSGSYIMVTEWSLSGLVGS